MKAVAAAERAIMDMLKKLAPIAVATCASFATTPTNAVIIGGIDFGALGLTSHFEVGTVASTFAASPGDPSQSYGFITTINGDSTYCADGTANCSLYFIANSTISSVSPAVVGNDLYFSGTTVQVYYSGAPAINLLGQDSVANLAYISGLTDWVALEGENGVDPTAAGLVADNRDTETLTGATISVTGAGLLSVDLGGPGLASVAAYLDSNMIPTFTGAFADIAFTSSANNFVLNPFDLAGPLGDSCVTPLPSVGDWCLAGSLDLRGRTVVTVPEPGTLGLMGLGLLTLVAVARRQTAKR